MIPDRIGLVYLATPYTKMPDIDRAFQQAAKVGAQLSKSGLAIFAPIVHSHPMVRALGLDHRDPAIYAALNKRMMEVCGVLVVVQMEGWQESDGMKEEVEAFERAHKPIYDCDPLDFPHLVLKRRPDKISAYDAILRGRTKAVEESPSLEAQTSQHSSQKTESTNVSD